jgi:hypothetical protein
VRFGNIALMPHEPVPIRLEPGTAKVPRPAFLVEARSWGGQSGSPAFVYFLPDRTGALAPSSGAPIYLLGVVHGHYDIEQPVVLAGSDSESARISVNAGMAVVIPAQDLVDLICREDVIAARHYPPSP